MKIFKKTKRSKKTTKTEADSVSPLSSPERTLTSGYDLVPTNECKTPEFLDKKETTSLNMSFTSATTAPLSLSDFSSSSRSIPSLTSPSVYSPPFSGGPDPEDDTHCRNDKSWYKYNDKIAWKNAGLYDDNDKGSSPQQGSSSRQNGHSNENLRCDDINTSTINKTTSDRGLNRRRASIQFGSSVTNNNNESNSLLAWPSLDLKSVHHKEKDKDSASFFDITPLKKGQAKKVRRRSSIGVPSSSYYLADYSLSMNWTSETQDNHRDEALFRTSGNTELPYSPEANKVEAAVDTESSTVVGNQMQDKDGFIYASTARNINGSLEDAAKYGYEYVTHGNCNSVALSRNDVNKIPTQDNDTEVTQANRYASPDCNENKEISHYGYFTPYINIENDKDDHSDVTPDCDEKDIYDYEDVSASDRDAKEKYGYEDNTTPDSKVKDIYGYGDGNPECIDKNKYEYGETDVAKNNELNHEHRRTPRRSSMKQNGQPRRASIQFGGEIEVSLPEGLTVKRRTSITFKEFTDIRQVAPAIELAEDPSELWLQVEDFERIKEKAISVTSKVNNNGGNPRFYAKKFCVRGLEKYLGSAGVTATGRKYDAMECVLNEQHVQRCTGKYDQEHLANLYKLFTTETQIEANNRGSRDAFEIEPYLIATRRRMYRRVSM